MAQSVADLDLSVIVPAHNEEDNVGPLVQEIDRTLDELRLDSEIIIVDDASTDSTLRKLESLMRSFERLRVLQLPARRDRRGYGQSAAFQEAITASRGRIIAMLDADLQNDPADLPAMLECLRVDSAELVQGDRSAGRQDNAIRRISSRVGRLTRRVLLGDTVRDTGCSLRVMKRDVAIRLPLMYRGMHRFIPITARQLGYTVVEYPVHHRPRVAGRAKYGVWNRAIPGLIDCFAVRWMRSRRVLIEAEVRVLPSSERTSVKHRVAETRPTAQV